VERRRVGGGKRSQHAIGTILRTVLPSGRPPLRSIATKASASA
jgi:hypothetical protein